MKAQKQDEKLTRKQYDESFKRDAVALVTEQGHRVTDAARRLGISPNLIYRWKQEFEQETMGTRLTADEREELTRLRRENRQLLMETEILKKATVGSTGRRNTCLQFIRRCAKAQGLAGTLIQAQRDSVQVRLGVTGQIRALWEVLA